MNRQKDFNYESAIIIGAGPVGLWSAIKMLENNFSRNVVLLDKRFSFDTKLNSWAERSIVVQFHRCLLSILKNGEPTIVCPYGVSKEQNEQHRSKYADLDHMSIKNIQITLRDHLSKYYSNRFLMLEMLEMGLKEGSPIISIGAGDHNTRLFKGNFNPEFVLDATGYHSVLMNKMLGVNFEGATEYGYALKITWPEHEVHQVAGKQTEFHDCHENSPFFSQGYSSVAEFAASISDAKEFFLECGYHFEEAEKRLPFLEKDKTLFSIKLPPFIRKIIDSKNDKIVYGKAVDLFKEIKNGKLNGINGFDFVNKLQAFKWKEADVLALAIRQTVNKSISIENLFFNLDYDKYNLKKVSVIFVPSRVERWLSANKKMTDIHLEIHNSFGDKSKSCYKVTTCAAGDSLTSTDFRHGLGINRGIHTATRLFEDKIDPEQVRAELVQNGYYELSDTSDQEIFNRAISCREWLLKQKINNMKINKR